MNYTYEIINVYERTMDVKYTSIHGEMLVGVRLPTVGESLESVIHQASPVPYWEEQLREVIVPDVGVTGSIGNSISSEPTLDDIKALKANEITSWRYNAEVSGVMVSGVLIATDRESQAKLSGALLGLLHGYTTELNWKGKDGKWITLGLAEIQALAEAVFHHVQQCFNVEKLLLSELELATTIEEVENIDVPEIVV